MPIAQLEAETARALGIYTWATKPAAAGNAGLAIKITGQYAGTYESNGTSWVSTSMVRQRATARRLLADYASTANLRRYGSGSRPRPEVTDASDIPSVVSSSTTIPSSDPTDPVTKRIDLFNGKAFENWGTTPLTQADMKLPRTYWRGINDVFPPVTSGSGVFGTHCITQAGTSGDCGTTTSVDGGNNWGISGYISEIAFIHEGVVVYVNLHSSTSAGFCIRVNGNIVTPSSIAGDITAPKMPFWLNSPNGGRWIKIKFPSAKRRTIVVSQIDPLCPSAIMCGAADTIMPVPPPLRIGYFGDSFTANTYSETTDQRYELDTWGHVLNAEFGSLYEKLIFAIGGSSLSKTDQVLPGQSGPYTAGARASHRKALQVASDGLDLDVLIALNGHNDANISSLPLFESEMRAFWADAREMHPNAILVLAGSNASPGIITSGTALSTEVLMRTIAQDLGIIFLPMQTLSPPLFNGSGKQGSTNGTGNTDILTGPDGTHPTVEGHRVIGQHIARSLVTALRST